MRPHRKRNTGPRGRNGSTAPAGIRNACSRLIRTRPAMSNGCIHPLSCACASQRRTRRSRRHAIIGGLSRPRAGPCTLGDIDPRDDPAAAADIISSGGTRFAAIRAPRWLAGLRRPGIIAAAAAAVLAALALTAHHGPARAAPVTVTSTAGSGRGGVFAQGTADGHGWRLAVQNIADPGYMCLPGVTIDGSDADPVSSVLHSPLESAIGNPAFVAPGPALPGVGIAFVQLPGDADRLWLDPVDGLQVSTRPVTVTACGQQFHLAGFAYPLTATLRMHAAFADGAPGAFTAPLSFSDPQPILAEPQVNGLWQDMDAAHAQMATQVLATGQAAGHPWSISVAFGTAGDCFTLVNGYVDNAGTNIRPDVNQTCGPMSTPGGPDLLVALPLAAPAGGSPGTGYAVSVSPGTTLLAARLSGGRTLPVFPVVVDGRAYAAFFVASPQHLTALTWIDGRGRATASHLPQDGYEQVQP
jgi:hypothetical protein